MTPRELFKENGRWKDRNNEEREFKGRVNKDLDVGDVVESFDHEGKPVRKVVLERQENPIGAVVIVTREESI